MKKMKGFSVYFTKIPCPLCNAEDFTILYKSTLTNMDFDPRIIKENLKNSLDDYTKHGQIVRCDRCSLIYVNPRENLSLLLKGYEEVEDPEYIETEKYRKTLLSEHLEQIEKWKSGGKLLDVGCFAGYFLTLAKKNGWQAYGIEPSKWAVKIAKGNGAEIIGKDIETCTLTKYTFDAISLWDVIEHLAEPKQILQKIHKALKHDGIIALGTPNVDSLFARILQDRCPFFIRMHLILYSPKTLARLLEENGFSVVSHSTYGRVFPLSYVLDRIQTKNRLIKKIRNGIKSLPILPNLRLRIDFKDSFIMIAKKI